MPVNEFYLKREHILGFSLLKLNSNLSNNVFVKEDKLSIAYHYYRKKNHIKNDGLCR